MALSCPTCRRPMLRLEQREGRLVGVCATCPAPIAFEDPADPPMRDARTWPEPSTRRLKAPEGWEAVETGGRAGPRIGFAASERSVWMERVWRTGTARALSLALAAACALAAVLGTQMLAANDWDTTWRRSIWTGKREPSSVSGAGLFGLVLGVGWGYVFLARGLNRTRVEARDGRLVVRHGPLPWRGVRRIDAKDIEQVYCDEIVHRRTYRVLLQVRGAGKPLLVVEGLPTAREALFVESRLELALGIPDRRVSGELLEKALRR